MDSSSLSHQGCPGAEYIIQNAGLDKSQAGIKIPRRNINNLRHTGDITLKWRTSKEPLEEGERAKEGEIEECEKADLKLNISKTKIMAFGSTTSWQIEGGKVETVTDFNCLDSKISADGDCSHEIKDACSLEGKLWQT